MRFRLIGALWMGLCLGTVATAAASVQQAVTTPEQQFGHEIGADYELVNYTELYEYFGKLAGESDRMIVEDIGLTEEGRPQVMAVITNHRTENRATTATLRGPRRARPRVAGALLAINLRRRATDLAARSRRVRTHAHARLGHDHELLQEHATAAAAEHVGDDISCLEGAGLVEKRNRYSHRQTLIRMSTPAGMFSLLRASTVLGVGSLMWMIRLCVRISNCSRDFLSMCGDRRTV